MTFLPDASWTLNEILALYSKTISTRKRSHRTETYRINTLSKNMGHRLLSEITPRHIAEFRDARLMEHHAMNSAKQLAPATVRHELMLLSHIFNTAITEWGMESLNNPVLKIRKPRASTGRTRRLMDTELKILKSATSQHQNPEFRAIITLALETAMRQGEILSLEWENISWRKKTALLPVTKNGNVREVPLSRNALNALQTMRQQDKGRIFSYTTSGIKSAWKSFIKRLAINDFHFHDLRHEAISSLFERGFNAIEVATISGHRSMTMLKRYSHLNAHDLVKKLDPKPRQRNTRALLREQLLPYPAIITSYHNHTKISFPDFPGLVVSERHEQIALKESGEQLLRQLILLICDGHPPPPPSDLESVLTTTRNKHRAILISPI